jgi:putative ABC transport system ATP-binding protein
LTSSAALVAAHNIDLDYGGDPVLRDITIEFEGPGSIAVTGPSGSGKTSLLYVMSGLERRATGRVRLVGEDITAMSPDELASHRLSHVGFVFQSADLVPELTLRENVALPLELAGIPRRETRSRVAELLMRLDLQSCADRRPPQVSGGQAQRCAVARAVAGRPRVVFADEPTGALDRTNRDVVLEVLRDQVAEIEGLLVAVTHDPEVAARFERQVHLSDGCIASAG